MAGPGSERVVIRWEWIEDITAGDGVVVRAAASQIQLPAGAFGLSPEDLAGQLRLARSIQHRPEVIGGLGP